MPLEILGRGKDDSNSSCKYLGFEQALWVSVVPNKVISLIKSVKSVLLTCQNRQISINRADQTNKKKIHLNSSWFKIRLSTSHCILFVWSVFIPWKCFNTSAEIGSTTWNTCFWHSSSKPSGRGSCSVTNNPLLELKGTRYKSSSIMYNFHTPQKIRNSNEVLSLKRENLKRFSQKKTLKVYINLNLSS